MMLLWQNTEVVDALRRILENYKYLEYDEKHSMDQDKLKIVITDGKKVPQNYVIAQRVRDDLCTATGLIFRVPSTSSNCPYFYIRPPIEEKRKTPAQQCAENRAEIEDYEAYVGYRTRSG